MFFGDPLLYLTPDGATMRFAGGQPKMDLKGYINTALISLFTKRGWCGNIFEAEPDRNIGSDFMAEVEKPITATSMQNIKRAAENALQSKLFAGVDVDVHNPTGYRINVTARLFITDTSGIEFEILYGNSAYTITSGRLFGDMIIEGGDMIIEFGDMGQ